MPVRPSPPRTSRAPAGRAVGIAVAPCFTLPVFTLLVLTLLVLAACATRDPGARPAADSARGMADAPATGARGDTLAVVGVAFDSAAAALVGRLVDDVVGDSALQSSWALEPLARHIGMVHATIGDAHFLLADSLVGYDGPKARWRIRQAQRVHAPAAGEGWVTSCVTGGAASSDGTIIARVTLTPGDTLPTPRDAWRFDPVAWRFALFPAATLSCYNEGGGP